MAQDATTRGGLKTDKRAGIFWSLRRALARLLLPFEIAEPDDLAALVPHPQGTGLWIMDRNGNVFALGGAPEFREVPQPDPWRGGSFVAMAATPSGQGIWTLNKNGNILAFGDAPEFREVPQPVPWRGGSFVAMAATPSGQGVWILDSKGNVVSFGDAAEFSPPRKVR
jgi:hypothetical protein